MSRGLGPWSDSYGVGCKGAPMRAPTLGNPQGRSGYRPYHYGLQQADMQMQAMQQQTALEMQMRQYQANYAQISAQQQQIGFMGNLVGSARYEDFTPIQEDPWSFGPTRNDYPKVKFMMRTRSGKISVAILEVLFWFGGAAFITVGIIVPVFIKFMTALWAWALT